MRAQLIGTDDARWAALGGVDADFYHRPDYAALCAAHERHEAVALLVEEGDRLLLLPLLRRTSPEGWSDVTSAHGYPGALLRGDDDGFFGRALEAGLVPLRGLGVVSLYVRLHPLLNPRPPSGVGEVVRHPDTVAVDLTLSDEELWSQTRPRVRSQVNRAVRAGHRMRVDRSAAALATFRRLYDATMERLGAGAAYRFDERYFVGLAEALGEALHVVTVDVGGEVAAGGVWIESAGIVHLHLAASDPRFDREHPTKLMYHLMRAWSRDRGARWMHLGGGRGTAEDTLLRFKAGFSSLRAPYRTVRVIVDHERYAALVVERFPAGSAGPRPDWFPAYRAPAADAA